MSASLCRDSLLISEPMKMPVVGIGTWQTEDEEIEPVLMTAIEVGYRHIDTAYHYKNEVAIGNTLQKLFDSGVVQREDLFIVTKLPLIGNREEDVARFLKLSLAALQLDYVDLYLIHHPIGFKNFGPDDHFPKGEDGKLCLDIETNHVKIWKAMEAQVEAGRTKSIGVSNFNKKQIERILENSNLPISNLQIELHVYLQQKELVSFCKQNNITVCAYAPLGSPGLMRGVEKLCGTSKGVMNLSPITDPLILEIAERHQKSPAQVLLRFLLQYGVAVIPKSCNPGRIKENYEVFDFELSEDEFEKISLLDRGEEGRMFNNSGIYLEMTNHPEYPHPIL